MTPVVQSRVDADERVAVITTEFDHPPEVVWTLFSDPDRLAGWWGPPRMPMTIHRHELRPGGTVDLSVTTPGGEIRGRWRIHHVAAPHALAFTFTSDGLDPTEIAVDIRPTPSGSTTMTIEARFASDPSMRHALDIGFVDGVTRSCTAARRVLATA